MGQWSFAFADSLRRYWRNSSPSDPVGNEIQLVGFERPGIRRFYDPPVLWVPAITELSEGYQWTWIGRMWPESTEADADTLYFRAEGQESVELLDGGSLLAWKIRVQAGPDFPLAAQGAVDLTGWPMAVRKKTFDPLHYWYGPFNDGGPHRLRLRDDAVLFVPDLSTPVREESMGGLRARFAPGTSGERHR